MTQVKALFKNLLLLLLVFGVALLVATLGIQASSMTSAKAQETVGIPIPESNITTVGIPESNIISEKPPLKETQPSSLNSAARGSSNSAPATMCYTCGGSWPNFNGAIPTPSPATERGASCASFAFGVKFSTQLGDRIPYLCTK